MLPFHFSPLHYPIQSLCSVFDSFLKWCCNLQCISKLNPFMLHNHEHQVSPVTLMKSFLNRGVYSKLNYNLIELFLGINMVKMAIKTTILVCRHPNPANFATGQSLLSFLVLLPCCCYQQPIHPVFYHIPSFLYISLFCYLFPLPSSLAAFLPTLVHYQRHVEVETPLYSCLVLSHLLCL